MSTSPQPPPLEQDEECDAVCEKSLNLNEENPNLPDPHRSSDPEILASKQTLPVPEENTSEEDEDEEKEEVAREDSPGMPLSIGTPITCRRVSAHDGTLASPSTQSITRKDGKKRKKGKGKGKGKPSIKKLLANEEKLQTLMVGLNPIPFMPLKLLDFQKHEKLLRKLSLWDFVHIDFDRNIRVDLIAQLVATYTPKLRASYVNDFRVLVNRADLARALKLPLKKEKGNAGAMEVDLDSEPLSDDSMTFILDLVSDWVLLHEDMWMMPNEIMEWLKLIKEGYPEKVDWAGLFWFMVEKELKQGAQLKNCYYASHLQQLIKVQRAELFLMEEPNAGDMELDPMFTKEDNQVNQGDAKAVGEIESHEEEGCAIAGPSTELTLGQDSEKEEDMKDVERMDSETCKVSDKDGGGEKQGQWLLNGKNNRQEHFFQRCNRVSSMDLLNFEDGKEEEEVEEMDEEEEEVEEENGQKFHAFPNEDALEGDGFCGNLLQTIEVNEMPFSSQGLLQNSSSVDIRADMQQIVSNPPFFNNSGKSIMEEDNHISHHPFNEHNKRLRINDSWDHMLSDLPMCMNIIHKASERAMMFHQQKEQAIEQSSMNQQILLSELQKRDALIEHLHKTRLEEAQKKDGEIYRLERELYLMGSVLDGYRKAFKETQKAFDEYRERAQLPEESTYRDAGPGGLMLSGAEIERLRRKQEEEYRINCLIVKQKVEEAEEEYVCQFNGFLEKLNILNERLTDTETAFKELIQISGKRKAVQSEETSLELAELLPNPEIEETELEVAEPSQDTETEEIGLEYAEPLPNPEIEETELEVAEPSPDTETEETVLEFAETLPNPDTGEKGLDVPGSSPSPQLEEEEAEVSLPPIT